MQASGAVAIFLLARDRLHDRWLAVALAAVLLLNPTYQWLTWEFFHPDALAIAPLLFAYWAARTARWKWFVLFAVLAAACKEDVALAIAVMGVLIAVRGHRKIGLLTLAASIAWYTIATRVVIPLSNGIGPFYDSFFGDLGKNPVEVGTHLATHPREAVELATAARPGQLLRDDVRTGGVPAAAGDPHAAHRRADARGEHVLVVPVHARDPLPLLVAGARRHHPGDGRGDRVGGGQEAGARALPGRAGGGDVAGRDGGVGTVTDRREVPLRDLAPAGRLGRRRATRPSTSYPMAPPTSAIYNLLPHLAHRDEIYDFPVPWRNVNWGVDGEHLADPAGVQWLVVDRREMSAEDVALLERLTARQFRVVFDRDDIVVAKRVHARRRRSRERRLAGGLDQTEIAVVAAVEHRGAAGLAVGEQVEVVAEELQLQGGFARIHGLGGEPLRADDARVRGVVVVLELAVARRRRRTRRSRRCRCRWHRCACAGAND